ncbi:MAG: SUMF1/EgtB/PvdO family nonheme iron enzyme, partial [Chloroflexota bacterium]
IGRVPYDADTPAGVMLKQNTEPLPRPKQFVAGLPEDVERVLYKALAKNPMERYTSMDAFAATLERLAALTTHPLPQAREGNQTTIDYGDGIQPSSSVKSAQSEKSAFQTSASLWDIPAADVKQPIPDHPNRERTPTPPPYIPQPPPSAKSEKSALQTFLVVGGIGMGLMILIVIVGAASWLMNRTSKPSNVMNAETVQANAQETLSAMSKQTPTFSLQGEGQGEGGVSVTPASQLVSTHILNKDGMVMVYVPAGEFLMGSNDGDSDEKPQHKVYLDGYWMDKTEVTNAMYQKCVADGSCKDPVGGKASATHTDYYGNSQYANYPVINVDWNQAQAYCKWAGGRLPSEAQWEKAARGEDGRKYPWGDGAPDSSLLNYNQNVGDTTEVGKYPSDASPYGIMDMSGNVWEWVNDWYDENYYKNLPQKNPMGSDSGEYRGLRGGSWVNEAWVVRGANRSWNLPGYRNHYYVGFRCAR